jgi:hypothetical protein
MNEASGESQRELTEAQRYELAARAAQIKFDETGKLPKNISLTPYGRFQVRVMIDGKLKRSTVKTMYEAVRERDVLKAKQQDARADAKKILDGKEVEKHVKATGPNGKPLPRNVLYYAASQKYQTHATVGEANKKYVGYFTTVEEAVKERDSEEEAAYDLISPVEATRCCKLCKIAFLNDRALKRHEQQTHNGGGRRFCADETCKTLAICDSTFCRQHTVERPFVCEEEGCGKCFKTKGDLKSHMKTHNGELQQPCKGTNHIDGRYCPLKLNGDTNRYDGLCQRCFCNAFPNDPRTTKANKFTHAKERMVRERLENAFPGYRWTFDRTYATGVLFRPDAKAVTKTVTVIVEIDEFSHKLRECAREREREKIFQKHAPKNNVVFVIRFNPDGYTDPETLVKVPSCFKFNKATALVQVPKTREADWNRRLDKLCATVQEIFDHQSTAEPASNYVLEHMENYEKYKHVNMIELFYDTVNERMRKEQEEAKKNAAEDEARRAQYHANQKRKREELEEDSDEDLNEDSDEETDNDE